MYNASIYTRATHVHCLSDAGSISMYRSQATFAITPSLSVIVYHVQSCMVCYTVSDYVAPRLLPLLDTLRPSQNGIKLH
jgi:hypothetical protein